MEDVDLLFGVDKEVDIAECSHFVPPTLVLASSYEVSFVTKEGWQSLFPDSSDDWGSLKGVVVRLVIWWDVRLRWFFVIGQPNISRRFWVSFFGLG